MFILLATVVFLAMISPGPDFILVTRNAIAYPRPQALATAFGIVAGCLIHASYCVLGLAVIITHSVLLFSFLKYAGACYLVYLGLKGLFSKSAPLKLEKSSREPLVTVRRAFNEGFFCNLLNPKCAVFLLSLFTQFISVDASFSEKVLVAGVFAGEALVYWPLLVLILQLQFFSVFYSHIHTYLDRACGLVLVALGIRVAWNRD